MQKNVGDLVMIFQDDPDDFPELENELGVVIDFYEWTNTRVYQVAVRGKVVDFYESEIAFVDWINQRGPE